MCFSKGSFGVANFVVGHLAQAFGPNVHDEQKAVGELTVVLGRTVSAVIFTLPLAILWTPAIFDVECHPPFTVFCRHYWIVGALVVGCFVSFEPFRAVNTALRVVRALLRPSLIWGLLLATMEPRADAVAEER